MEANAQEVQHRDRASEIHPEETGAFERAENHVLPAESTGAEARGGRLAFVRAERPRQGQVGAAADAAGARQEGHRRALQPDEGCQVSFRPHPPHR